MQTFVLFSLVPAIAALASLIAWALSRRTDWGYEATLLAMKDAATETENEAWSRALVTRHDCNTTMRGFRL